MVADSSANPENKEEEFLESQSMLADNSVSSQESYISEEANSIKSSTPREGTPRDFTPDVSRESVSSMKLRDRESLKNQRNLRLRYKKAILLTPSKC